MSPPATSARDRPSPAKTRTAGKGGQGSAAGRARAAAERQRLARRRRTLRRRFGAILVLALMVGAGALLIHPRVDQAVQELALPLRHEDIIRQQARAKGVDPSLIAAVIYTESRFRDQTSPAGAKGLMQILPSTAEYIATRSGGTAFERGDLATPQINIAYGTYYLRMLLDKYDGSRVLALAAYNGGEGKVDEWRRTAAARGEDFDVASHVPFPETRQYVGRVLAVQRRYRSEYASELGL